MTVSSELNRKQYAGNGVTTSFATSPVVFFNSSDLDVYVVTTATGAATLLTETTDYIVTGGAGSTGTVATTGLYGAPSASQTLVIVRNVPLTQAADFVQNDASDAEVVEDALDKLTMADQQLSARLTRSFTLADSDVSGASLTVPTPLADALVGWDAAGTALENKVPADIDLAVVSPFIETLLDDTTAAAARTTLDVPSNSEAILDSVIDAKGDLIVGTAADTPARKAVGTDFFDLAADSSQSDGLAYRKPVGAIASGRSIAARTNSGTPNSKIDITADELVVRATNGGAVVLQTVSVTIDITVSGANGLDTGAEASNTWYYGWVIAKPDGTVAGLLSASSTAPTMPSGYTMKALVTAVRNNGSSNFIAYRQFGNEAFYESRQSALASGASTSEATVPASAFVPPNAHAFKLSARLTLTNAGGSSAVGTASLRFISTLEFFGMSDYQLSGQTSPQQNAVIDMPNVSQQFFYLVSAGGGGCSPTLDAWVNGFKLPVGGV